MFVSFSSYFLLGDSSVVGKAEHLFRRNLLDQPSAGFINELVNHDIPGLHFNQHVRRADRGLGCVST